MSTNPTTEPDNRDALIARLRARISRLQAAAKHEDDCMNAAKTLIAELQARLAAAEKDAAHWLDELKQSRELLWERTTQRDTLFAALDRVDTEWDGETMHCPSEFMPQVIAAIAAGKENHD